jgi:hypothetical protein
MVDALFIWNCGEESIHRVENNAVRHSVPVLWPAPPVFDALLPPRPVTVVVFELTCQYRIIDDKRLSIFISTSGEEAWMELPLRKARLERELRICKLEIDELTQKGPPCKTT